MRIGIDIGGTKIEGIAIDGGGREVARIRAATPTGDYGATIRAVGGLVAELEKKHGKSSKSTVGVGIPGSISPATGLVQNSNSTWLIGRPLDKDLEAALERPVRLANDANCFAVSEAVDGAAAGAGVVFGVILGTGVGGGMAIHGRAIAGINSIAGEWGHTPLPWPRDDERPGADCYCGLKGCIETFLSGPGFAAEYRAAGGRDGISPAQIAALGEKGDGPASSALERYEERLARALALIINIIDPDVIVLGGGMSNIERLYENV
ncbi:MAG: ROK family protein, partial [Rhodospirillales bacterium]